MYFPKSQIKTNLYTNGKEFILKNSNSLYQGYYYETSNGRYFSGKNPNESPTFELIKTNLNQPTTNLPEDLQIENIPDSYYILENGYFQSTNLTFPNIPPSPPKQTYPIPTENDYKLGEFQRYFVKKGNEPKFIEISKEDYQKYVSQSKDVMFELYIPIQINWILTGDKNIAYKTNQNIVAKAERDNNAPGFSHYFKNKFTQFYK